MNESDSVVALVFSTDEFPYLVKRPDGQRDLPIRDGTATRSAHRHEVLDFMRLPAHVPIAVVMFADIAVDADPGDVDLTDPAEVLYTLHGNVGIYLDHDPAAPPAVLPAHLFGGR